MKNALLTSIASVGLIGSLQAATVIADRIVVTNSILNANAGTTVATHWAEIEVFQDVTVLNVAESLNGGVASANGGSGYGSAPSDVNDGNTNGAFGAGSVWHDTDPDGNPAPDVFTIMFAEATSVSSFNIWGRSDDGLSRDDNFLVEFYNGAELVGSNPNMGIGSSFNTGVTQITAVPEPVSLVMGLLSLGVLGLRRRRA